MSIFLYKQPFRATLNLKVSMRRSVVLLLILALSASSLIMIKPDHTPAQTPTPTPTPTPSPTLPTDPNQTSSPTPTPTPPQITPSSTSILTPTPTPSPPLTPTSVPTPTPLYPKPLVPEFNVRLIVLPPEVNKTIELTIKNQPFVPYYDSNSGWNISLYYNVRVRVNSGNWSILYATEDVKVQSSGESTILLYPSGVPDSEFQYFLGDKLLDLFLGDRVDFQVEAMIGYVHRVQQGNFAPYYFAGETSDWSNTQTIVISISNSSSTPTESLSPSPSPSTTVSILSPLNDSFFNGIGGVNYQLIYETNGTISWVGYSLNGANNVTVTGNSTFVNDFVSSNGYHTLTVYANDTSGNWAIPQTVTYLVNFYPDYTSTPSPSPTQQPTAEPSPTPNNIQENLTPILIIVGLAVVIVAVAGALFYFRRTKKQK